MANYRRIYARMARRAITQGKANIEAFVENLLEVGATPATIENMLLEDLKNDGPIFGNFFRALGGAAEAAVNTAHRQGGALATAEASVQLQRLEKISSMTGDELAKLLEEGNPEALEELTGSMGDVPLTWVAELINTCYNCLPLHGVTQTASEWAAQGLDPSTIHEGWTSQCHCVLKSEEEVGNKKELLSPLTRTTLKTSDGKKISKRTVRAIASTDIDKARKAVEEVRATEQGSKILSRLGKVNA